jgi:L-threonylcarbamoyladenylate synthase
VTKMNVETKIIQTSLPDAISAALSCLARGGLIAFPTDTVYGVGVSAFSSASIELLFQAKGRDFNKAIAVLIGSLEQLGLVTAGMNEKALHLARRFWPGALTLVVERHGDMPAIISPTSTVGVRMPNHPFALALLQKCGPLATTSANLSGGPNPMNATDVLNQLNGRIDLLLDGGLVIGGVPSTVVDCTTPELRILRNGAISAEEIHSAIKSG